MENGGSDGGVGAQARREAERVAGRVKDRMEDIRGYGEDAGERIRVFARERPLAAIGIAVGVGFVLGRLLSRA